METRPVNDVAGVNLPSAGKLSVVLWVLEILFILILSAGVILALIVYYYQTDEHYAGSRVQMFTPANLRIIAGQGEATEQGLRILQAGPQDHVLISSTITRFSSQDHDELRWQINGLQADGKVEFVWVNRDNPNQLQSTILPHQGQQSGQLSLVEMAGWEGDIGGVGLRIYGPLSEDLSVQRLVIKKATPSEQAMLMQLWQQWFALEGWSGRSAHFLSGGTLTPLFPMPLAMAAWVAVSLLLYVLMRPFFFMNKQRRRLRLWPLWIFIGVAWLLIDSRWQWNLWQQLLLTHDQFAGKTAIEKALLSKDNALFSYAQELKELLPQQPARIFLVNADPVDTTKYQRLRLAYHLLPHNVYTFSATPPDPHRTRAGDFLLLLKPVEKIGYDPKRQLLQWQQDKRLGVEPLHSHQLGYFFRIKTAES